MKRRPMVLALVLVGLVAAGCSSSDKAVPAAAPAPSAPGCPSGTSLNDRLCVAPGAQAEQAAALVRSTFQNEAPGALIFGVWQDGKPLVVGALGDSMTGVPATVDMHHRLGNISTPMLATVLLQQVEAGKLALSDPLSKWFPELPSADAITIDMLAHHTSGYRQYTAVDAFQKALYVNPFKKWNVDDVIAFGVAGGPTYPPGTSWNFSDTDTLILAKVLEKATGRPVDDLIKEGVLDRLGMTNTVPPDNASLPDPVLHSYTGERNVWEDATFWDPSWTGHAGGMGSNQDDLHRFIEALGSGALVSKASHEAQLAPTTVGKGTNTKTKYFGIGVGVVNGWVYTNPGLQGLHAAIGTLPGKKLSMVIYNTTTHETNLEKQATATTLFESVSALLAPDQPMKLDQG